MLQIHNFSGLYDAWRSVSDICSFDPGRRRIAEGAFRGGSRGGGSPPRSIEASYMAKQSPNISKSGFLESGFAHPTIYAPHQSTILINASSTRLQLSVRPRTPHPAGRLLPPLKGHKGGLLKGAIGPLNGRPSVWRTTSITDTTIETPH